MLHIEDTCILRGYYHHLMKEVFPTNECFGTNLVKIIEKDLRKMLLSSKEVEWNGCYQPITDKLESDPAKLAKLDKIKANPS